MAKHSGRPPPELRLRFALQEKPPNVRTPGRRAPLAFSTAEDERWVEGSYRLSRAGSYDSEHSGLFMSEESSLPGFRQQTGALSGSLCHAQI